MANSYWNNRWPDDLKALSRQLDREEARVKNLKYHVERCNPAEFDSTMDALNQAQDNFWTLHARLLREIHKWDEEHQQQA